MESRLVDTTSSTWRELLARVDHDFYHLPAYVELSAVQDGGEPRALFVEDGHRALLLPLVIRPIENDLHDATSPYGYPGTLVDGAPDRAFERDALLAGAKMMGEEGIVALFIRFHPLLNPEPPDGVGTLIQHGHTVTIDLTPPEDQLWAQTRRNHRQQIRQALDAGYVARIDEDWSCYEEFKRLYRATMEQRAAAAYYYFSDDYFARLRQALGDHVHVAVVAAPDDAIAAAALFVETEGIVQMHLTGHDEGHAFHQPMKLLFHFVRSWTKGRGDRLLHLGGGRGGEDDSLFHFKAGFSPIRQPFSSLRLVTRPEQYRDLVAARDPTLDAADMNGPFPLYRR